MIGMIVRDLMGTGHQLIITCKSSSCVRSWTTSCPTKTQLILLLQTGKVPKGGPVAKKNPKFPGWFSFKIHYSMKIQQFSQEFSKWKSLTNPTTRPPQPSAPEPSRSCYRSNAHASGRRFRFFFTVANKLGHGENSRYDDVCNYLAGGLKHFLFSSLFGGNDPIWRAYFSKGLKPPSSYVCN